MILIGGAIIGALVNSRASIFQASTHGGYYTLGFLAFLVLCAVCLKLILIHRRSQAGFWPYQLDILVLWTAQLFGFSLAHGSIWSDAVASTIVAWFISAFLGGILVVVTRRRQVSNG